MDQLELELKTTFLGQADQLMAEAENFFLELESCPGDVAILDSIFRVIHNIKGSANAVGFEQIGDFSHTFESLLLKLKKGQIKVNEPMVDLLLRANDFIGEMVVSLRFDMQAKFEVAPLKAQIEAAIASNGFADASSPSQINITSTQDKPTDRTSGSDAKREQSSRSNETMSDKVSDLQSITRVSRDSAALSDQVANVVPILSALRPREEGSPLNGGVELQVRSLSVTNYKIQPGERFLCFNLGEQEYAIPLASVKQVIAVPEFTPIPEAPSYFVGLANLRGKVIATLDLAKKLSIPNKLTSERATIILNTGEQNIGVNVDAVNNVFTPDHKDLSPRPDCDPNVRTEYIISVYRRDNVMILLIDIANALGLGDWDLIRAKSAADRAA